MTTDIRGVARRVKTDQARRAAKATPPRARSAAKPLLAPSTDAIRVEIPQISSRKPRKTREERFHSKVDRSGGPDACWPWTASIMQAQGYGQFNDVSPSTGHPTVRCAHVVAFELANGPVSDGMHVLHALGCHRRCCNPANLRAGTRRENRADARAEGKIGKGRKTSKL